MPRLVGREEYFTIHAPRQTGKTSALLALQDLLNNGVAGDYRCVYVNCDPVQAIRQDVREAMGAVQDELPLSAETRRWLIHAAKTSALPVRAWPSGKSFSACEAGRARSRLAAGSRSAWFAIELRFRPLHVHIAWMRLGDALPGPAAICD